jgi:hypothetical protein
MRKIFPTDWFGTIGGFHCMLSIFICAFSANWFHVVAAVGGSEPDSLI